MTQPTIAIPLPEPEDDPPEERNHNPYIVAAILALSIVVLLFYRLSGSQVVPDEQTNMAALQSKSKSNHIFVDVDGAVVRPGVYRLRVGSRVFDAIASAGGLKGDADRLQIKMAAKLRDEEKLIVPRIGQILPTPTVTPGSSATPVVEEDLPPEVSDNPEVPPDQPLPELTPPVEVPPAASPSPVAASTVPPPPPVDSHPPTGTTPAPAASAAPKPDVPAASKISINRASAEQLQNIPGVDAKLALDIVNYRKGPPPHAFTSLDDLTSVPGLKGPKFDEIQPYLKL